jgi:hypothetical protein
LEEAVKKMMIHLLQIMCHNEPHQTQRNLHQKLFLNRLLEHRIHFQAGMIMKIHLVLSLPKLANRRRWSNRLGPKLHRQKLVHSKWHEHQIRSQEEMMTEMYLRRIKSPSFLE